MKTGTRSMLLGGTLLGTMATGAALSASSPGYDADVSEVVELSATSNAALMRGDISEYRSLITYSDDFTFMGPFGGKPALRSAFTDERMNAMGQFFRNGTFEQELVQAYASKDLIVLAIVEQQRVEVGGLAAQDWPLRVTLVYRREGSEWQLAHRHADPLLSGVSLTEAAALARRK